MVRFVLLDPQLSADGNKNFICFLDLFKKKVSSDLSFPTMECIGSQYFEMSRKAGLYNSNFGKNMDAPLESGEKFLKDSTETVSVTESKSAVWTGESQGENSSLSPTAISLP